MSLEDLILYHNCPERAKIYNVVANKIWKATDIKGAELVLLCSYVLNSLIEEGRITYHEDKGFNKP